MTEQAAEEQANAAAVRVAALLALYQAGQISGPDLSAAVAAAVFASKITASVLADVLISTLTNLPPVGIRPSDAHLDRLAAAVTAIVEDTKGVSDADTPAERLERLAKGETVESHRRSLQDAIARQGFTHWRRVAAPDACEDCAPLSGEVQTIETTFYDHPFCRCTLRPSGPRVASAEPVAAPVAPSPARTTPSPPNRVLRIG